ncbi:MAG TPA: deoxynucleoside kinase [Wenzhouxiangella sp.]|nr:deoxynucleoside kinase [Wenzhouxiangella sp.]
MNSEAAGMTEQNPGYIVVEGPIGVGKTSLARRLADSFGSELLLEGAAENPFLERFYRNPRQGALSTQLFFLLQRARQIQELRQGDMFRPVRVADFLIEKDQLFARLTLDEQEYRLYEQVYGHLTLDVPVPDLVIYLQAPVDVLLGRIARRGIAYEQHIDAGYLERLSEGYAKFFFEFDACPLLIVNAAHIDLINDETAYAELLEQIHRIGSGRHYFNPMPVSL